MIVSKDDKLYCVRVFLRGSDSMVGNFFITNGKISHKHMIKQKIEACKPWGNYMNITKNGITSINGDINCFASLSSQTFMNSSSQVNINHCLATKNIPQHMNIFSFLHPWIFYASSENYSYAISMFNREYSYIDFTFIYVKLFHWFKSYFLLYCWNNQYLLGWEYMIFLATHLFVPSIYLSTIKDSRSPRLLKFMLVGHWILHLLIDSILYEQSPNICKTYTVQVALQK